MKRCLLTSAWLGLTSCSTTANPPSLLPRAIEMRQDKSTALPVAAAPTAIDPTLKTKIDLFVAEARAGDADFAKALQSGRVAIATGKNATSGSEAWTAAELAVSALQVARQRSASALADIDALSITLGETAFRNRQAAGLSEIQATQVEIEAIVARQTEILNALGR